MSRERDLAEQRIRIPPVRMCGFDLGGDEGVSKDSGNGRGILQACKEGDGGPIASDTSEGVPNSPLRGGARTMGFSPLEAAFGD